MAPPSLAKPSSVAAETPVSEAVREEVLNFIGFVHDHISPRCIQGRFVVNERCCQVSGVLHGGVCAMVAESVASVGAVVASGFQRAAGIQMSFDHMNSVPLGTEVLVTAKPARLDKNVQVWDVAFSTIATSAGEQDEIGSNFASARVMLMVGLTGQAQRKYTAGLKLHARL